MNNTCEYLWTLLAMAVSVLPIAIVLFRVSFVKNAVFSLKKFWHNHSFQNKVLFLILFTTAFIYGSSKPSKGNGMKADDATVQTLGKREKVSHIVVPLHTERRERDTTRSLTNDFLLVSGIDFSQHNNELNFSLTWSDDLFDFAESRAVDLFVSTNLTLSTWFHGGKYLLPYDKTNYYFSVDLYNPAYVALLMLTNKCAFFKFGLDADSDGDSLTDACEKYLHGTNPILTDSDHDGIDDGLEIRMGLNPLNSDIDNDGIPDGIELDLGGNPISLDSDNDGMEDRWEFDNALDISDDSDGLIDSDGDGVPNLYEYANNSNPNFQDEWMTPKIIAGDTSKTNGVADLSSAFMRSVPYSIIEIADGIYSGTGWTGLTIPTNQVLITTGNKGKSRGVTIKSDRDFAVFYFNKHQNNHTIIHGLTLELSKPDQIQTAFWCGSGTPFVRPPTPSSPCFRNITLRMTYPGTHYYGWHIRHYQPSETIISSCEINALGATWVHAIHLEDASPLSVENCSFINFPTNDTSVAAGIVALTKTHDNDIAENDTAIEIRNCYFDSSFTNAYPFAMVEDGDGDYLVTMDNCVIPSDLFPSYLSNISSNIFVTNICVAAYGGTEEGSFLTGRGKNVRFSEYDIDGDRWEDAPSIGCDEYYPPVNDQRDSDGDGLTDYDERMHYYTDPNSPDLDNDGLFDNEEIANGTNPNDANSYFRKVFLTINEVFSFGETNYCYITTNNTDFSNAHTSFSFVGGYTNTLELADTSIPHYVTAFRDTNNDGIFNGTDLNVHGTISTNKIIQSMNLSVPADSDSDRIYDVWEINNGLSPTNSVDAHLDNDGDGIINLHEFWLDTNPNIYTETNSPLRLFAKSIDDRLTPNPADNKKTKFSQYSAGNFVINTNCWAYGIDTTSASMWNSHEYNKRTGTAISKRHLVQANHFPIYRNKAVFFYCNDDTIHTNYIENYAQVLSTDISVCSLRHELPDTITPAMVLPQDYRVYIGNGKGLPYLCFDYDEHAIVGDIASIGTDVGCGRPMLEHRRQYYERIISGDSGNPCFLVIGNSVIMLNEYHYATHGPFLTYYMEEIQQVMDELSPGYELNIFNFSEFVKIKEDRVW